MNNNNNNNNSKNSNNNNNNNNNNEKNNSSNNCLQKVTKIVLIFRLGMGFAEDHGSLVIKSHISNHIEGAY